MENKIWFSEPLLKWAREQDKDFVAEMEESKRLENGQNPENWE